MKKKCILALILGAAFMAQGCGFTEGTDAVVTVVDSTPTPEPTEAPEETATPTPEATAEADSTAAADPTAQAAATEQTPSGINVQAQDATYYAVEGVNLRSDASADAEFVAGVLSGESLKCTGICDNGWIRETITDRLVMHPVIMSARHRRQVRQQRRQILQRQHSKGHRKENPGNCILVNNQCRCRVFYVYRM